MNGRTLGPLRCGGYVAFLQAVSVGIGFTRVA